MSGYNETQAVFALSMLSNSASGETGSVSELEAKALVAINQALQSEQIESNMGEWNVVWGPAIYQAPGSNLADNAMFIVKAGAGTLNPGELVVGIAGTNGASVFDWLLEDFFVEVSIPWWTGNPPAGLKPKISAGTFTGLGILQNLVPGIGIPGYGTQIAEFLTSALTEKTRVTVTGHSLGGALSPAMALWLSDTQGTWDPNRFGTIYCLPSAGPSSGNRDFAAYYDSQLAKRTTRVFNDLDLVPQAWVKSTLEASPNLYQPYIDPGIAAQLLVDWAVEISQSQNYGQICANTPALDGTVNQSLIDPSKTGCENYAGQILFQHLWAYFQLLDFPPQVSVSHPLAAAVAKYEAVLVQRFERKALLLKQARRLTGQPMPAAPREKKSSPQRSRAVRPAKSSQTIVRP